MLGQAVGGGSVLGGIRAPDRDVGAGRGQPFGNAQADAAVAAGHQCHFAAQVEWVLCHVFVSLGGGTLFTWQRVQGVVGMDEIAEAGDGRRTGHGHRRPMTD
ncbi:hypothetical protein D9M72_371630 [compost metagenome]